MMSPAAKQLTAKLQTKGKHRPHKMVKKKLPDGVPFPAALKKAADAAAEETPAEGGEA